MYRSSLGEERSSISIMGVCREEGGIVMERLTQKDEQGNWSLRGVPSEQLHEGQIITKDLYERLYGALWKLMEYEDTGLMPEEVEEIKAGNILNMDDKSILLRQREDGTWEEKPEPYAVIECETEEDFNHIKQRCLNLQAGYRWRRGCRKMIIIFCCLLKISLFHWSEDMGLTVMVEAHFTWAIVLGRILVYGRICLLMPGCHCRSRIGGRGKDEKMLWNLQMA